MAWVIATAIFVLFSVYDTSRRPKSSPWWIALIGLTALKFSVLLSVALPLPIVALFYTEGDVPTSVAVGATIAGLICLYFAPDLISKLQQRAHALAGVGKPTITWKKKQKR